MQLTEKLSALKPNEILPQLYSMLDRAKLEVSWWGERRVAIGGYEGTVALAELAKKFLSLPNLYAERLSLKERLERVQTWEKMKAVCQKSDQAVRKTCIYRFAVPLFEMRPWCRVCWGDPVAMVEDWHGTGCAQLLEFPQDDFLELFPGQEPLGKMTSVRGEYWFATPEMVRKTLLKA